MKKKLWLLISFSFCFALLVPGIAFAEENEKDLIEFTPDLAIETAQDFADSIFPNENLIASDPTIFTDLNGKAIGYIINFEKNSRPYGYIIFDSTDPSLISEFVVEDEVVNPFIDNENPNIKTSRALSSDSTAIVKTDLFTYTAINLETKANVNNYGESIDMEQNTLGGFESSNNSNNSRSVNPAEWDDIFINIVPGDYTTISNKWVTPFIGNSEAEIKNATGGKYACAVVALMDCAAYYDPNYSNQNLSATYWTIATATQTTHDSSGQGSTLNSKIGSGFAQYMANRNVSIAHYSKNNPTWNDYVNSINSWNMPVFCAGLLDQNGTRSGHAMSVQGYRNVQSVSSGSYIHTLGVHDGWNKFARYVNIDFANYYDTYGVFFH